ncbi:MAG TPA: hypothetical protein VI198_03615, partial [Candidatus Eisenbacteria bacterium]
MPLRRLVLYSYLALAVGLLPMARTASAAPEEGSASSAAALGLARMSQETPHKIAAPNGAYNVSLTLDGARVELLLEPYSLRRPSAQAVVEGPGGARTVIELPPSKTFRGQVRGDATGVVAATLDGDALRARIILDDGSDWYVQPVPGDPAGAHAVYRGTDVAETGGTCAAGEAPATTREPLAAPQAQSSGCVDADIAIEADYGYYVWNASSSAQTIGDIDAVVNAMELIYARDVKIGYKITNYL